MIGNIFFHTTLTPTPKPQIPPTLLMLLDTRPKEDKKQRQSLFCPSLSSLFSLYQLTTRTFHPLWTSSDVISRRGKKWHGMAEKGFWTAPNAVKFRISLLWLRCVMMHLSNLNLSAQLQGAAKFVVSFCYFLRQCKVWRQRENLRPARCRVICQFQLKFSLYKHFPILCLVSSKQSY